MRKPIFLIVLLICCRHLVAQDSTSTKQEVWPEVNLFYKLNSTFRIYANYSATKLKNSSYTDGGWGLYLDYFAFPWGLRKKLDPNLRDSTRGYYLWLRGGYMYSTTPSDSKDPFKMHTIVTEIHTFILRLIFMENIMPTSTKKGLTDLGFLPASKRSLPSI